MANILIPFTSRDLRDLYLEHAALGRPVALDELAELVAEWVTEEQVERAAEQLNESGGVSLDHWRGTVYLTVRY